MRKGRGASGRRGSQESDSKPNALRGGQYKRSYCERKGGTLVHLSLLVRKEERADLSELA